MRISDWSSDVCSSDLVRVDAAQIRAHQAIGNNLRIALRNTIGHEEGAAEVRGRVRRDENLHDLVTPSCLSEPVEPGGVIDEDLAEDACIGDPSVQDRKSTRLNSSH